MMRTWCAVQFCTFLLFVLEARVSAFSLSPAKVTCGAGAFVTTSLCAKTSSTGSGDFPPEEDEEAVSAGNVDWDAEWKKVVRNQDQPTERPGKDFYKSEAEIAAIKAANKAQKDLAEAASKASDAVPSWQSIKGDWKFWIGVLAVISIGASVISATGQTQSFTNDSFYI